jgi:hypothetical protein
MNVNHVHLNTTSASTFNFISILKAKINNSSEHQLFVRIFGKSFSKFVNLSNFFGLSIYLDWAPAIPSVPQYFLVSFNLGEESDENFNSTVDAV